VLFSKVIIRIIEPRRMRWVRHVAQMGERRNTYRLLVVKAEGKMLLGGPRRWWMDNIRMDILELGWGDVDWLKIGTGGELL
jgi:hypothetical protein